MKFEDLAKEVQDKIMSRFANWEMDGKEAFENPEIFPEEFSQLEPDEMLKILELKEISHKYSVSNYPSLRSDINNVILEDIKENQARGKTTMTSEEEEASMQDFLEDIKDGDIDDDGVRDMIGSLNEADELIGIVELLGDLLIGGGMVLTGIQAVSKIVNGNIELDEAPKFLTKEVGGKLIKYAIIGVLLHSGEPIIVSGTVATIIYKNISRLAKNLIANDGSAAIRIVQDHFCRQLIQNFGKPIVSTSANISGENTPEQFAEISEEIKNNVDYIVNLRHNEIMSNTSDILFITKDGSIRKIRS